MSNTDNLLPTLAESELIPTAELARFGESELVLNLMQQLQLGCYRREGDTFWWIGSGSPLLHDHERWLYRFSRNVLTMRGTFAGIMVDLLDTCQRSGAENLIDSLEWVSAALQTLGVRLGLGSPMTAPQLATQLGVFANFGNLTLESAQRFHLDTLLWHPDLHDLLYHIDTYQANHPEIGELPRELLLRMHGLGTYVELQHEGVDLLY